MIYRHFKGGIYKVINEAIHTETGEKLVIYRSLDDGKLYARPMDMFYSKVDKEKYPNAKQEYRFENIDEVLDSYESIREQVSAKEQGGNR